MTGPMCVEENSGAQLESWTSGAGLSRGEHFDFREKARVPAGERESEDQIITKIIKIYSA